MDQSEAEKLFAEQNLEDITFEPDVEGEPIEDPEFFRQFGVSSTKAFQKQKTPKRAREEATEPPPRKSPTPYEFGFGSQETIPVSTRPISPRQPVTQVHQPITRVPTATTAPQIPIGEPEDLLKKFDDDYNSILLVGDAYNVKRNPYQWAYLLRTYGIETNRLANKTEVIEARKAKLKALTMLYQTLSVRFDFLFKQSPPSVNFKEVWQYIDILLEMFEGNGGKIPVNRESQDIEEELLVLYGLPSRQKTAVAPPPPPPAATPPSGLFQNIVRSALGQTPPPAQPPQRPPPIQQQPQARIPAPQIRPPPAPGIPGQARRGDEPDPLSSLNDPCFTMLQNALYNGMSFFKIFFSEVFFFVKRIF